jgi:hypothetical protein
VLLLHSAQSAPHAYRPRQPSLPFIHVSTLNHKHARFRILRGFEGFPTYEFVPVRTFMMIAAVDRSDGTWTIELHMVGSLPGPMGCWWTCRISDRRNCPVPITRPRWADVSCGEHRCLALESALNLQYVTKSYYWTVTCAPTPITCFAILIVNAEEREFSSFYII